MAAEPIATAGFGALLELNAELRATSANKKNIAAAPLRIMLPLILLFVFIHFFLSSFLSQICGAKFSKILQGSNDVRGAEEKHVKLAQQARRFAAWHFRGACKRVFMEAVSDVNTIFVSYAKKY